MIENCRICGNRSGNKNHTVREMLLGTRSEFEYLECKSCGCLQIKKIPAEMSVYYPQNYHVFQPKVPARPKASVFRRKLKNYWKRAYIDNSYLGKAVVLVLGRPGVPIWIEKTAVNTKSKILDIGCGDGSRLSRLREMGFKNLTGLDLYSNNTEKSEQSLRFIFGDISELSELDTKYDLIMLHHSLEHMENQLDTLLQVGTLLNEQGALLIRIPIVSSYAWRKYKTNWFSLDAPRHFYLHSNKSMRLLAEKSGFEISEIFYDSQAQSLWASEQYVEDIPFNDKRSVQNGMDDAIFDCSQIRAFEHLAKELNNSGEGDQAGYILHKTSQSISPS